MKIFRVPIILLILLIISACGAKEDRRDTVKESLKMEAKLYITEAESNVKKDRSSAIDYLRTSGKYEEDKYLSEKYYQLADLLEKNDLKGLIKFYIEMGGKEEDLSLKSNISEASEFEKQNIENDKMFGVFALHTVQPYLKSDIKVSLEDRTAIAEIIRDNLVWVLDENVERFNDLANYIENDNYTEADQVFSELLPLYVPADKREDFNKLMDYTEKDDLEKAIKELIKE